MISRWCNNSKRACGWGKGQWIVSLSPTTPSSSRQNQSLLQMTFPLLPLSQRISSIAPLVGWLIDWPLSLTRKRASMLATSLSQLTQTCGVLFTRKERWKSIVERWRKMEWLLTLYGQTIQWMWVCVSMCVVKAQCIKHFEIERLTWSKLLSALHNHLSWSLSVCMREYINAFVFLWYLLLKALLLMLVLIYSSIVWPGFHSCLLTIGCLCLLFHTHTHT